MSEPSARWHRQHRRRQPIQTAASRANCVQLGRDGRYLATFTPAADALWQSERHFNLVLVGKQVWRVDAMARRVRKHPQVGKRLFWLEGISDEYLGQVYAQANCLVAASFGEGFGLPLIEAAQCQMPIIARAIPVCREVAGDHALYFDANAPDALRQALSDWLDLHAKGQAPQSTGMPWLTWKQSAAQLLERLTGTSRDDSSE